MKSIARLLRISPKKINLIADLVRNKDAVMALDILKFTPKKGAGILLKAVGSAVSNAENNFKQDRDSLYIKEIVVTKGLTLKRSVPISKGRMHPILKRGSHVTVTLGVRESVKPAQKEVKAAKQEAATEKTAAKKEVKEKKPAKKTVVKAKAKS
jgi:large subunit ribosomal protein L22